MEIIDLKKLLLNTAWFEDNIYLDKYIALVLANVETSNINTNKHHIIPVSCWKLMDKVIDETLCVNLLPSDHVIAHHLLGLCTIGKLRYKMQSCFLRMSGNKQFIEELDYSQLTEINIIKQEFSIERAKQLTGVKLSTERREHTSQMSKAMWANPEFKEKMKQLAKDRAAKQTPEQKAAISKKISLSKKGTKCNFRTEASNEKGLKTKLERYGTLNLSTETKKKISNTLQGHPVSAETRKKISEAGKGRIPWNKGKKLKKE